MADPLEPITAKRAVESKVDLLTAWPAMVATAEMKQESRESEQSFDQTLLETGGVSAMTDQQLGDADGIATCAVHHHSRAERKLASCLS